MNSYFNFFGNIILVQGPGQFQQHLPARQNQHVKRLLSRLVLLKHIANRNKVDTPWPSYSRQPITIFVSENAAAFHHKTVGIDSREADTLSEFPLIRKERRQKHRAQLDLFL